MQNIILIRDNVINFAILFLQSGQKITIISNFVEKSKKTAHVSGNDILCWGRFVTWTQKDLPDLW